MTIPLTGTGGLFTRIGKIGKVVSDVNAYQATTIPTDIQNIINQYPTDEGLYDGINGQLTGNQAAVGGVLSYLAGVAANTINKMVVQDNPLSSSNDINLSLKEVIRQMVAASASVKTATVGSSVSSANVTNGNGVVVVSTKTISGVSAENSIPENIRLVVSADDSTNPGLAQNETFTVLAEYPENDPLASDWPIGSGVAANASAINASVDVSQGTLLTNGDFELWTVANVPDQWVIATGTAGSTVKESTAQHYTGLASLNFAGNGSENTALTQVFADGTNGTAGTLSFQTLYAINFWCKVDAVPGAGVLTVDLIDGSGTTILDPAGNANSFTVSLPGLTTSWVAKSGVFITPHIMPTTAKLRLRLSTALDNAKNLYIDRLAFGPMTTLYTTGPSLAVFSGSSNFYIPDFFVVTTTNNHGGSGTLNSFQVLFDRLFNMRGQGLLLPSAGSPTISDTLIA